MVICECAFDVFGVVEKCNEKCDIVKWKSIEYLCILYCKIKVYKKCVSRIIVYSKLYI